MSYNVEGGEMSQQEADAYIRMIREKHPEQMRTILKYSVGNGVTQIRFSLLSSNG